MTVTYTAQSFTKDVVIQPDVDITVDGVPNWVTVTPRITRGTGRNVPTTYTFTFTVTENTLSTGRMAVIEFNGMFGCVDSFILMQDRQPAAPPPAVRGCTDALALNYNANATEDDGSCNYFVAVPGCIDPNATNYNPNATQDDGTCRYPADEPPPAPVFDECNNISADVTSLSFISEGGSQVVRITINPNINIQVASIPSGFSVSPGSYTGNSQNEEVTVEFTVTAARNTGDERSGDIRFIANGCEANVLVTQRRGRAEVISCKCYEIFTDSGATFYFRYIDCASGLLLSDNVPNGTGKRVCARARPVASIGDGDITDLGTTCTNRDNCGDFVAPVTCNVYTLNAREDRDATFSFTTCVKGTTETLTIPAGDGGIEVCARSRPRLTAGGGSIITGGTCNRDYDLPAPTPVDPYYYYFLQTCSGNFPIRLRSTRSLNQLSLNQSFFIDGQCMYVSQITTRSGYLGQTDVDLPATSYTSCTTCDDAQTVPPPPPPPPTPTSKRAVLAYFQTRNSNSASDAVRACDRSRVEIVYWNVDENPRNLLQTAGDLHPIFTDSSLTTYAPEGFYTRGSTSYFWNGRSWATDVGYSCRGTAGGAPVTV